MPNPRPAPPSRSPLVLLALSVAGGVLLGCMAAPAAAPPSSDAVAGTTSSVPGTASVPPGSIEPAPSATVARTPGPTVPRVPALQPPAYASRVVVPELGIDLPVISGDLQPPPNYPLCDVAAYLTRFNQPYENGVTYISAHAQKGMFLPLLEASRRQDGQELVGLPVAVYTNDGRLFQYRIERVVPHATDYSLLAEVPLDQRNLILQTSEGPFGTVEKLQVLAAFESETTVDLDEATPEARPRDCKPPETSATPAP